MTSLRSAVPFWTQITVRPRTPHLDDHFPWRLLGVLTSTIVAFWFAHAEVIRSSMDGSRATYIALLPVWAVMIAVGYRNASTRGVHDRESDWIVAVCIGVAASAAVLGICARLPSSSVLWRLPLLLVVIWVFCVAAVVFGLRFTLHMWPLWLFILFAGNTFTFLITASWFGGSDRAVVLLACALSTVAFFLAARHERHTTGWTLAVALSSAVVGIWLAPDSVVTATLLAAGAIPVVAYLAVLMASRRDPAAAPGEERFPTRSRRSYVALAIATAAIAMIGARGWETHAAPPQADDDWLAGAHLVEHERYGFAAALLGPGATLTRYLPDERRPSVAVDVLFSPGLGALTDYDDAVWYPTGSPAEFRDLSTDNGIRQQEVFSDPTSDSATWYLRTWVWKVNGGYQRVTVIANQQLRDTGLPPEPQRLGLGNQMISPAVWLLRQQPDTETVVDRRVTDEVGGVAGDIVSAAGLPE